MKFWAKIRFRKTEDAQYLVRAFFEEFNPENSISIRGKDASVEIIFDHPPMKIIKAIDHCEIVNFSYGRELEEDNSKENGKRFEADEFSEELNQDVDKAQITEKEEVKTDEEMLSAKSNTKIQKQDTRANPNKRKGRIPKKIEELELNVQEFEEFAKKSTSFEHFVKLVAEWFEMERRQDFFEKLMIVSSEIDRISWEKLEESLKEHNVFFSAWDRIWCTRRVCAKLGDSVTMKRFFLTVKKYKDYHFGAEEIQSTTTETTLEEKVDNSEKHNWTENAQDNVSEEDVCEEKNTTGKAEMQCTPTIFHLDEVLESLDKTQPVEERVRTILDIMGLEKRSQEEQREILHIAVVAMGIRNMDFDSIFAKVTEIPAEYVMNARLTFSEFVNGFVSEYGYYEKIKLLDFLKELQEIVMNEEEIED